MRIALDILRHDAPFLLAVQVEKMPHGEMAEIYTGIGLRESFIGSRYSPGTAEEAIQFAVGKGITNGSLIRQDLWSPRGRLGTFPGFRVRRPLISRLTARKRLPFRIALERITSLWICGRRRENRRMEASF